MMPSKNGSWKHRQHTYKRRGSESGNRRLWGSHHCPVCGKWCYKTRDDAEAAVRIMHPGASVHYYRCKSNGTVWWHFTSMTAEQVRRIKAAGYEEENNSGEPEDFVALPCYVSQGRATPTTKPRDKTPATCATRRSNSEQQKLRQRQRVRGRRRTGHHATAPAAQPGVRDGLRHAAAPASRHMSKDGDRPAPLPPADPACGFTCHWVYDPDKGINHWSLVLDPGCTTHSRD